MNSTTEPIKVQLPGSLMDRIADSLESDLGRRFGRRGAWTIEEIGKGYRCTIFATVEDASYIARYLDGLAGITGAGMDPEDRQDARRKGSAAGRASAMIRAQLR